MCDDLHMQSPAHSTSNPTPLPRLYDDLAYLWPILSPPEQYAVEAALLKWLMEEHCGTDQPLDILEFGAGGGHTLVHLAQAGHHCTAVDLSASMLEHCKQLIPSARTEVGDMRNIDLGQQYDAILIHDAVDYLLTEADLTATFKTIKQHLKPNGIAFVAPTYTEELFRDNDLEEEIAEDECVSPDGRTHIQYTSQLVDQKPADHLFEMVLTYKMTPLNESGQPTSPQPAETIEDRHTCGLFAESTWKSLLEQEGFEVDVLAMEDGDPFAEESEEQEVDQIEDTSDAPNEAALPFTLFIATLP